MGECYNLMHAMSGVSTGKAGCCFRLEQHLLVITSKIGIALLHSVSTGVFSLCMTVLTYGRCGAQTRMLCRSSLGSS